MRDPDVHMLRYFKGRKSGPPNHVFEWTSHLKPDLLSEEQRDLYQHPLTVFAATMRANLYLRFGLSRQGTSATFRRSMEQIAKADMDEEIRRASDISKQQGLPAAAARNASLQRFHASVKLSSQKASEPEGVPHKRGRKLFLASLAKLVVNVACDSFDAAKSCQIGTPEACQAKWIGVATHNIPGNRRARERCGGRMAPWRWRDGSAADGPRWSR
eukprot:2042081-Prymnesium_polylepis.1